MNDERKCALCEDGLDPLVLCPECERYVQDLECERVVDEMACDDLVCWCLERAGASDE